MVGRSHLRELQERSVRNAVPPDRGMGGWAWARRRPLPIPAPRDRSGRCPGLPRRRSTLGPRRQRTEPAPARTTRRCTPVVRS
eukprot:scaffold93489_cov63-Phaeocystis_antarctica.AAC.1